MLKLRKSSGFPNRDNTSMGEIMLPQREMEREESLLGACVSLVPAVSEVQWHSRSSPDGDVSLQISWPFCLN